MCQRAQKDLGHKTQARKATNCSNVCGSISLLHLYAGGTQSCRGLPGVSPSTILGLQKTGLPSLLGISFYSLLAIQRSPCSPESRMGQEPFRDCPFCLTPIAKARNDCTSPSQQWESRVSKTQYSWSGPARQVVDRVAGKTQIKSQRPGLLAQPCNGLPL